MLRDLLFPSGTQSAPREEDRTTNLLDQLNGGTWFKRFRKSIRYKQEQWKNCEGSGKSVALIYGRSKRLLDAWQHKIRILLRRVENDVVGSAGCFWILISFTQNVPDISCCLKNFRTGVETLVSNHFLPLILLKSIMEACSRSLELIKFVNCSIALYFPLFSAKSLSAAESLPNQ